LVFGRGHIATAIVAAVLLGAAILSSQLAHGSSAANDTTDNTIDNTSTDPIDNTVDDNWTATDDITGGNLNPDTSAGFENDSSIGTPNTDLAGKNIVPPSFGDGPNYFSDGLTLTQGTEKMTFDISKYNQELPKQVIVQDMNINMTFKTYEAYNPNGVVHMGLYLIPRGEDMITTNSIASITYDKNSPSIVNDTNHILSNVTASSISDGKFQYTEFSFVPLKSYDKMSFLVRAWNDHLYSTDTRIHDNLDILDTTQLPTTTKIYDNMADLQNQLEEDGFVKPQILGHIHDTSSIFNDSPGKVSWFYDGKVKTVTLVIEDGSGKVVDMRSASLISQDTIPQNQNFLVGNTYYSHHSLSRLNIDELETTKSAEELKALDLMMELYGRDYVQQFDFLGKQ